MNRHGNAKEVAILKQMCLMILQAISWLMYNEFAAS